MREFGIKLNLGEKNMSRNITSNADEKYIELLNENFRLSSVEEILRYFLQKFKNKIALASSLSLEDQVLTDILYKIDKKARIFTLDTGRLPYDTYNLIDKTNKKYKNILEVHFPQNNEVENYVKEYGINAFYESIEERKLCCKIRKVNPLKIALSNLDGWITGLRKDQSETRNKISIVEFDEAHQIIKINPLANWTDAKLWEYIKQNNVPYNVLFKQGYKSIGCAPCSRAIDENEHPRKGRWWWENPESKECGLHLK